MYADDIRAYRPRDEQEETDKRIILEYVDQYPDTVLTRRNEYAHITSSGFVVNADASKVLMAHHNIYKVWAWTGGHADGDGALSQSVALREAREETGRLPCAPPLARHCLLDILPVWGHVKRGKYVAAHQHLNVSYLLTADEDDALAVREGENTAWPGCPPNALPS